MVEGSPRPRPSKLEAFAAAPMDSHHSEAAQPRSPPPRRPRQSCTASRIVVGAAWRLRMGTLL